MNTERSTSLASEWSQNTNLLERGSFTSQRTFSTSPETLFPLLCPTTEYDWLPGWSCELLHSNSGYAEHNVIFRTSSLGFEEVLVCTRFEPNRAIDYTRFSEELCGKLEISLTDNCDGTVTARWVVILSALTENGNQALSMLDAGRQRLEGFLDALEHYVGTGEMVEVE